MPFPTLSHTNIDVRCLLLSDQICNELLSKLNCFLGPFSRSQQSFSILPFTAVDEEIKIPVAKLMSAIWMHLIQGASRLLRLRAGAS